MPSSTFAQAPAATATISETLQDLHNFREMGRVLYVAAHPDDENTQLITYLARGRGYRTAYLSVTRGDGGQNLLGPEFGSTLGLARTEELLAARRLDGGLQFFTRALDFGFSKDVRETLNNWDRQQVVADIVRVIRTFQPDVIITRFSPQPGGTHGHHTASAVLAIEAFKLAGDSKAFPEQLTTLQPWQPKRILQNGGGGGFGRSAGPVPAGAITMEAGGDDPVTGEAFGSIAGRSRAMHKTQGFGGYTGGGGGPRQEIFLLLDGELATKDILDGVDTTWNRIPGGAEIGQLTDTLIANFKADDPAASVPALLVVRSKLLALPGGSVVNDKRQQLDHILQSCLGLSVETTVAQAEVVAGEKLKLQERVTLTSKVPVKWTQVRYPANDRHTSPAVTLQPNQPSLQEATETLPDNTSSSQPYWLREDSAAGMFQVADANLIGRPENPPAFPVAYVFEIDGSKQPLVINDEPVQVISGATPETSRRRLEVIPPVSVRFVTAVKLFAPGASQPVEVELTAARTGVSGQVELEAPAGWKISPASQPFKFGAVGEKNKFSFTLTASLQPSTVPVTAFADVSGKRYGTEHNVVSYGHIPTLLLQPQAKLKAVSVDLAVKSKNIGYLPGAGDTVAESIEQMGCKVTMLTGADLTAEILKAYDAVVIGVRAFNTRTDLVPNLPGLFSYVEAGGTVIAQYNRPGRDLKTEQPAPYPLHITDERVTDEKAPVLILAPESPALNVPNKINPGDFDGWIQERGSYYPSTWDPHFTPILASGDPGEQPLQGGLLIAHHGKGYFVYTGLSFFRQLPDGVPGAYRLFANLLSLGK